MIDARALAADAAALVQVRRQPERLGHLPEALQRRALVAGDARHRDERGRVAGQRVGVDHGAASSAAGSASSSAIA